VWRETGFEHGWLGGGERMPLPLTPTAAGRGTVARRAFFISTWSRRSCVGGECTCMSGIGLTGCIGGDVALALLPVLPVLLARLIGVRVRASSLPSLPSTFPPRCDRVMITTDGRFHTNHVQRWRVEAKPTRRAGENLTIEVGGNGERERRMMGTESGAP